MSRKIQVEEWLLEKVKNGDLTVDGAANLIDCSHHTITRALQAKYGVTGRDIRREKKVERMLTTLTSRFAERAQIEDEESRKEPEPEQVAVVKKEKPPPKPVIAGPWRAWIWITEPSGNGKWMDLGDWDTEQEAWERLLIELDHQPRCVLPSRILPAEIGGRHAASNL